MFAEVRDNEFNDLVQKGWLVAGGVNGTYKLSTKGLDQFTRLVESLDAKAQVLINLKLVANAEQPIATIKGYMN